MKVVIDGVLYVPKVMGLGEHQFGSLIHAARKRLGRTLDEVAIDIGITKGALWVLEQGRTEPRLRTVQKVLNYYGLDFKDVAFFEPTPD